MEFQSESKKKAKETNISESEELKLRKERSQPPKMPFFLSAESFTGVGGLYTCLLTFLGIEQLHLMEKHQLLLGGGCLII